MSYREAINKQIMLESDHPSLAGHFPANPVMLDYIRQCIEEWKHISIQASDLKSVKFLSPVMMSDMSSQSLNIWLDEVITSNSLKTVTIEFRCMQDDDLIVQGRWVLRAEESQ